VIVAIEGVSCTGKTTLAAGLTAQLGWQAIACYFHVAADPSILGAPMAASDAELLQALDAHLDVEQQRHLLAASALTRDGGVILDRSVDTLLAHARAIGRLRGWDVNRQARTAVARQVTANAAAVPDLTLLLTADAATLAARAVSRPDLPAIYYDSEFAEHFNGHFSDPMSPRCVRIRTDTTPTEVLENALAEVAAVRGP
jgi:thymidylate kinase